MGRIFGGLALGIVKVGRYGDDRAINVVVKRVFSPKAQRGQNLGTDFNWAFFTGHGLQRDHAGLVDQLVRQLHTAANVVNASPHQPLDRRNGVSRVIHLGRQGGIANLALVAWKVTHHARQNHPSLVVWQAFRHAIANTGHQRMGCAQVNADGDAPFVRVRRLARFGNLEECHVA